MPYTEKAADLDPLRRLALIDMSYSRLDTYKTCPAKYYFTYIQQEPRTFFQAATLGNIIHDALEYTLEPGEKVNSQELFENFEMARMSYDPDNQIDQAKIDAGIQMLQEFIDRHTDETFPIFAKELPFSVVMGGARFNGFIDRVDVKDDVVTVTDYKSGVKEVAYKDVSTNLQLGLYALVMADMFPDKQIYVQLYYLKTGRIKGHLYTTDDLVSIKRQILEIVQEIIETRNFKYTLNGSACRWCDHARTGACSTGVKRITRK